jgi:hypothetical protein
MSDSEKTNQSIDDAKNATGNVLATVMELKQSNPKVFFGAIAGVVVLLILVMSIGGGSNEVLPGKAMKDHVIGQNYVLRGANSSDANGKVRVVQVPGSVAAFDDSEEDPKEQACNHLVAETQVKALGFQDFMGKKNAFVNVEVLSGNCKGKKGWALAVDVQ